MNEAIQERFESKQGWFRIVVNVLVCLAILGAAVVAVIVINRTEPTAQKFNTTRKSAALVDSITVVRGTYSPRLIVLGTVESAQQIDLSPRVGGQVVDLLPEFVPGGMVHKGDLLLRIDPADFENALSIRMSELEQAKASMEMTIDNTNSSLVRREPQIASIRAQVSAAKAAVERAQLDLERTNVYAPFDAQVLTRSVNIGSQIRPGDELGQLIGLDEYWVMAAVPVRSLRWVQLPFTVGQNLSSEPNQSSGLGIEGRPGSKVVLRNKDTWGPNVEREAIVSRLIGTLDQQTRLARLLITVDDPLGQKSDVPPLILNTLIETEIEGKPIEDVVRLRREFVRDQDTVWVMKHEKLEIRKTEVVFRDAEYAYIRKGLESGEEVVTTTLATVAEGVGLRKTVQVSESTESSAGAVAK